MITRSLLIKTMLTFERAQEIVLKSAKLVGTENVDIGCAANRVLAEDIKSDMDMPPFDKSAMDGYACRRDDLENELVVIETIPAGTVPQKTIGANQCSQIMTGGVVPAGSDCVIMKEYVESQNENTIRFVGRKTDDNICKKGEDVKTGDVVLEKGTLLGPQHIAVLASAGRVKPLVSKKAKVAVIATGNELVDPAEKPEFSQIRNSNSFQLAAQAESTGAIVKNYGIAKDKEADIDSIFKRAIEENDLLIVSGGVSVGDFDLVPGILKQNNIDLLFEKVAVKPGKPTVFGLSEKIYCFGLPGNPVSTFILFELLVKPFLYKLMGHDYKYHDIAVPLQQAIKRKKTDRQFWIPVKITQAGTAMPVEYHGSAHIGALTDADGLVCIDTGVAEIETQTIVPVRLI